MKKLAVLILVALVAVSTMSFAQKGKMSIGGDLGLFMPMGDMGDVLSMGFGLCPTFDYGMSEQLALTGSVGYVSWGAKEAIAGFETSFTDIPLKAGAKYFFGTGKVKPYGIAELGLHMMTASVKGSFMGYSLDESASESDLGFAFGAGFAYPMNEKIDLNVLGQYESIMTEGESTNNLVIKVGIKYALK